MKKLNTILEWIYYVLSLVWLIWGVYYFFVAAPTHLQNVTTASLGLLLAIAIFYLGFLHKKISLLDKLSFYTVASCINLIILALTFLLSLIPDNVLVVVFILTPILGIVSGVTILSGIYEVRRVWRGSIPTGAVLVIASLIVGYIFASS